jgi:putative membrane protein
MFAGILALIVGISLAFILPATITPQWWFVIIAGFLAISAMFLPGISGSFILLILGMYEFMILSIQSLNISVIALFLLGAIIGEIFISRLVSFLLKKYKSHTFSVLLGLVIGCLAVPLKRLIDTWSNQSIILAIVCFLVGVLLVWLINRLS